MLGLQDRLRSRDWHLSLHNQVPRHLFSRHRWHGQRDEPASQWWEFSCPDWDQGELTFTTEHCIDFLRQSVMCHGDVGLITFEWSPTNLIPVANGTTHQCVNWGKLDQWTKERTVDMLQPGWLVHPTLGKWEDYYSSFCPLSKSLKILRFFFTRSSIS